jgi:hypothetical protein
MGSDTMAYAREKRAEWVGFWWRWATWTGWWAPAHFSQFVCGPVMQISLHRAVVATAFAFLACVAKAESQYDKPQPQPLFMSMSDKDPKLMASVEGAQRSLPEFRKLLNTVASDINIPMVKSHFTDGKPKSKGVWLWLIVKEAKETGFVAEVFEAPPEFPSLKKGSRHWVANGLVADWMIVEDAGTLHGGYSIRLQRERVPEAERASFDKYVGAKSYAPLPR